MDFHHIYHPPPNPRNMVRSNANPSPTKPKAKAKPKAKPKGVAKPKVQRAAKQVAAGSSSKVPTMNGSFDDGVNLGYSVGFQDSELEYAGHAGLQQEVQELQERNNLLQGAVTKAATTIEEAKAAIAVQNGKLASVEGELAVVKAAKLPAQPAAGELDTANANYRQTKALLVSAEARIKALEAQDKALRAQLVEAGNTIQGLIPVH